MRYDGLQRTRRASARMIFVVVVVSLSPVGAHSNVKIQSPLRAFHSRRLAEGGVPCSEFNQSVLIAEGNFATFFAFFGVVITQSSTLHPITKPTTIKTVIWRA